MLKPAYDASNGADGYVSMEVEPGIAYDTERTFEQARWIANEVDRPNLMVKIPATMAGLPAIEDSIAHGTSINITLIFSLERYKAVVEAYLRGLERLVASGGDPSKIASVASFFVSRVDTEADKRLEAVGNKKLQGKLAIANAKLAYAHYLEAFSGPRWEFLEGKGATKQRCLWASTSTKNPDYRDVIYVEELIGPDTVNTMPLETIEAFQDHGEVRGDTVRDGVAEAQELIERAARGRRRLRRRRRDARGRRRPEVQRRVRPDRRPASARSAQPWRLREGRVVERIWARDSGVWTGADEGAWLGWLDVPWRMREDVDLLLQFADSVVDRVDAVVLLGMGGSSLAPEVIKRTFRQETFHVLDTTHPQAIRALESQIDVSRTLFISASKSGSTLETRSHTDYFWERAGRNGDLFAAITDPGSELEQLARKREFAAVFAGEPKIGGRYSALSAFGMVPAALMGIDVSLFLDRAIEMAEACRLAEGNPGLELGQSLGESWRAGRDKVCIEATPGGFGLWAEQLLAESTGKHGKGLIPAPGEPADGPTGRRRRCV